MNNTIEKVSTSQVEVTSKYINSGFNKKIIVPRVGTPSGQSILLPRNNELNINEKNPNLRIVHSEARSNGEEVHLVRPNPGITLSTNDIVNRLVSQYDYKTQDVIAEK